MEVLSLKLLQIKALPEVVPPIMAPPERGTFFRRQVYKSVGITDAFYGFWKVKKTSWFSDLFIFKRQCIYSS